MENGGLKNTYRVVFEEFDTENHIVRGAFEILAENSDFFGLVRQFFWILNGIFIHF